MHQVVIGAAYGDEGKGRTVNSLATERSLVVRFNGGAQAGHTVVHNGVRHVFKHIGSGHLKGARTHLSKHFVLNPDLFLKEVIKLGDNAPSVGQVTRDPQCYLTTPFDIVINQLSVANRNHGTTGLGFGETVFRCSRYFGCWSDDVSEVMLKWVPTRCRELGIDPKHPRIKKCWDLLGDWKKNLETFEAYVPTRRDEDILDEEHLIFEGAQGLLLDQDRLQDFPHLTRSNTGLRNVASLVPNDFEYQVNYVTRAYTTRHGNGPLPHEVEKLEGYSTLDTTNLTNKHQGKLRFSPLDLDTIRLAVVRDIRTYGNQEGWHVRAVVTCLDQAPRLVDVVDRGTKIQVEREDLGDYVRRAFIADEVLETWEP